MVGEGLHPPPPRPLSASVETPAASVPSPFGVPWMDSHPQLTGIRQPPPPNTEVCFEVETVSRPY